MCAIFLLRETIPPNLKYKNSMRFVTFRRGGHILIVRSARALPKTSMEEMIMNNCFCRLFEDNTVWLIIIAILILSSCNNGCGCGNNYNNGCGCGC